MIIMTQIRSVCQSYLQHYSSIKNETLNNSESQSLRVSPLVLSLLIYF